MCTIKGLHVYHPDRAPRGPRSNKAVRWTPCPCCWQGWRCPHSREASQCRTAQSPTVGRITFQHHTPSRVYASKLCSVSLLGFPREHPEADPGTSGEQFLRSFTQVRLHCTEFWSKKSTGRNNTFWRRCRIHSLC